jgi:hypothetical protein
MDKLCEEELQALRDENRDLRIQLDFTIEVIKRLIEAGKAFTLEFLLSEDEDTFVYLADDWAKTVIEWERCDFALQNLWRFEAE